MATNEIEHVRAQALSSSQRGSLGIIAGALLSLGLQEGSAGALWPDVIDAFDVSNGAFGVAAGIGLSVGFPIFIVGGRITTLFDKRTLLAVAFGLMAIALAGITIGHGVAILALIFAVRGVSICVLELAANSLAMEVEHQTHRHFMSLLHSGYSGGLVIGAGLAWVVVQAGLSFRAVFTILVVVMVVLAGVAIRERFAHPIARARTEVAGANALSLSLFKRQDIRLLSLICAMSFCGELLIAQWITIYLRDERGFSSSVGVIAVILLGISMFVGRLVNVSTTAKLGPRNALLAQGIILSIGAVLIVATESSTLTLAGCGIAGLGLAGMAPTALSMAGAAVPSAPGAASGASLIGGYLGLALIPFVAGFIASVASVRAVLAIELAFGATVILTALWLSRIDSVTFESPENGRA